MDEADLEALLDEVRDGREEDRATDWKRTWWNFDKEKGRSEFIKDIAAMANTNTRDTKVIVVGVASGGVLYDAPLPEDESRLQQRLQAITPIPNVAFRMMRRPSGETLTVIEVLEPFDKPYVAKVNNRNQIFVRQGSSTTTATRSMIDRWYQDARSEPELELLVGGQIVGADTVVDYIRPRHEAKSEVFEVGGKAFRMPFSHFETDPAEEADAANRSVWLNLSLRNLGGRPSFHVVVDLIVEPISDLQLWDSSPPLAKPPTTRWQTNQNRIVHVDRWGAVDGHGEARQRVQRINPQLEEELVPMKVVVQKNDFDDPLPARVSFRVTDEIGERLVGAFTAQVVFKGRKIVKAESRLRR